MKLMLTELSFRSKAFFKKWNEKNRNSYWKLVLKEIEPKFSLCFWIECENEIHFRSKNLSLRKTEDGHVLNSWLTALLFKNLMRKCRRVLLTVFSSPCQFHRIRKHWIYHAEIYTQDKAQGRKLNNL